MCGFVLSVNDDALDIRRLTGHLRHRGPDNTRFFEGQGVRCGFNRLAIVDRDARSDQPMGDSSGRYLLAFNGEIYNHHALRDRLAGRYRIHFATRSDTEVLLYGLIHEGQAFAAELDGIFAFAFVDLQSRQVTVGRDAFGVKPLYYSSQGLRLYISSEVRILRHALGGQIRLSSLARFMSYGIVGGSDSMVTGVNELEPNTVRVFRPGGESVTSTIHQFAFDVCDAVAIGEVRDMLYRTIDSQKPDLPYGVLLSGGLDSTLVLERCVGDRQLSGAYSIDVIHPDMSERRWQEYVVTTLGCQAKYRPIELRREDLSIESIARFTDGLDYPLFHPNFIGAFQLARLASDDGLKVLLSGEGADELFLGYRWFSSNQRPSEFLEYVPLSAVRQLLHTEASAMATDGMNLLELFQQIYLRRWLLRQDLTGMAHSVEIRVPFLGLELVRMMNQLSFQFKQGSGESKWIIKKLLAERFSEEFVARRKIGFDVPLNDWIGDEHLDFLRHHSDVVDAATLDAVLGDYQGSHVRNRLIFSLTSLSLWLDSLN